MACLGGRAELSVVAGRTGEPASVVEQRLAPALDDGLLVVEPGRTRQCASATTASARRSSTGCSRRDGSELQLAMARRLAAAPELFAVAAEQYLPAVDAIDDPAERRQVGGRCCARAAGKAAMIGDNRLVNALLAAALRLDRPERDRHADRDARRPPRRAVRHWRAWRRPTQEYRAIAGLSHQRLQRADATAVQVRSLTHRNRFREALRLGLESLRELGIAVPAAGRSPPSSTASSTTCTGGSTAATIRSARQITDPTAARRGPSDQRVLPAAYSAAELPMVAWLGLEARADLAGPRPGPDAVGPGQPCRLRRGRAARRLRRRVPGVPADPGAGRGARLRARDVAGALRVLPPELLVRARREQRRGGSAAREGLIAGGDVANAGVHLPPDRRGPARLRALAGRLAAEIEAGLAFMRRTGSDEGGQWLDCYHWLGAVLRGERLPGARAARHRQVRRQPAGAALTRSSPARSPPRSSTIRTAWAAHGGRDAAVPGVPGPLPHRLRVPAARARPRRQARAADGDERGELLSELDEVTRWLAERAADAPDNFLHLLRLLEAERAWTAGDFRAAVLAFDAARREVSQRQRPWHRALITERAARFRLAHGLDHAGYDLLAQARREYLAWGATAKVAQLDWAYPTLRSQPDATAGRAASTVPIAARP